MDAQDSRKYCKSWRSQDCTNCEHMSKETACYYYKTRHKLWHVGRGNPRTGERCEGCELKDYSLVKLFIERIKMDTSDLYETIGCLNIEIVARNRDMIVILESIVESLGSNTSKAGIIELRSKDLEREAESPTASAQDTIGNVVVYKERTAKNNRVHVQPAT